jgi:hypothetical protein
MPGSSAAFLYTCVRTPFGRYGGGLADVRPDDLAASALQGLLAKVPDLEPGRIDEVILGNANGAGEENRNVARMAALLAGIPVSAFQVAANGDLANWHTGAPGSIPAVGGGMDLAIGAKNTYVMMTLFAKDGSPKLVPTCTYPLTGLACVSRVYTGHATFEITEDGVTVLETFGMTVDQLADRLALPLR